MSKVCLSVTLCSLAVSLLLCHMYMLILPLRLPVPLLHYGRRQDTTNCTEQQHHGFIHLEPRTAVWYECCNVSYERASCSSTLPCDR